MSEAFTFSRKKQAGSCRKKRRRRGPEARPRSCRVGTRGVSPPRRRRDRRVPLRTGRGGARSRSWGARASPPRVSAPPERVEENLQRLSVDDALDEAVADDRAAEEVGHRGERVGDIAWGWRVDVQVARRGAASVCARRRRTGSFRRSFFQAFSRSARDLIFLKRGRVIV